MTAPRRICAWYGVGPNYVPVLRELRRRYPEAHITAVVPPAYAVPEAVYELADEVVVTERDRYTPLAPGPCLRLARQLRAGQYDLYVTLFDTYQKRILAALSGSKRCQAWRRDFRIRDIEPTVGAVVRAEFFGGIRRRWFFLRTWLKAHFVFIRSAR